MEETGLTLAELSQKTGIPPRTIRYYISKGVLPPPTKRGRGARYSEEHLERLAEIRQLQKEGLTLSQIAAKLRQDAKPPSLRLDTWLSIQVAEDVVILVRSSAPAWRKFIVLKEAEKLSRELGGMQQRSRKQPRGEDPQGQKENNNT